MRGQVKYAVSELVFFFNAKSLQPSMRVDSTTLVLRVQGFPNRSNDQELLNRVMKGNIYPGVLYVQRFNNIAEYNR